MSLLPSVNLNHRPLVGYPIQKTKNSMQQFSLLHLVRYYPQRLKNRPNPQHFRHRQLERPRQNYWHHRQHLLRYQKQHCRLHSIVQRLNLHCFLESLLVPLRQKPKLLLYYQHHLDCLPTLGSLRLPRRYFQHPSLPSTQSCSVDFVDSAVGRAYPRRSCPSVLPRH